MKRIDRRNFIKLSLTAATGVFAGSLYAFSMKGGKKDILAIEDLQKYDWGFLVDTTRCIGCGACVRACKAENSVPDTFFRTWVEQFEISDDGEVRVTSPNGALEGFKGNLFPEDEKTKAFFVPKLCNHCRNSACTQVCPVGASFHSPDGVVLIDKDHCVGCGYCVQACPYGCRYIDHSIGLADKCTLCYHRIKKGESPACVMACPRGARIFGNLKNPESHLNKVLRKRRYGILKADMGTDPKCYYIGLDLEVK